MKRKGIPLFVFAFHIWSTTLVSGIWVSTYRFIRSTWNKVGHNKSNTSYMPVHRCKVKSCPPTKIICSHNLLSNRPQSSDFQNHSFNVKKRRIYLAELTLHLKSRSVCATSQCPYLQACIKAVFKIQIKDPIQPYFIISIAKKCIKKGGYIHPRKSHISCELISDPMI
jgi:hypothetical protein